MKLSTRFKTEAERIQKVRGHFKLVSLGQNGFELFRYSAELLLKKDDHL